MSSSPLVNSLVKNWLFKTAPDIDEPPFQFVHTMDLSVVDMMLCVSPDLVVHVTEIWAVWISQVGTWTQENLVFLDVRSAVCGALFCWNIKSLPDTLRIAGSNMTSLWRREAAPKKSVRDITRISCFVTTMKLPHALQIYSTVFVNAVPFFKVMQQQTIGKVGNLIMYLWADNFCLQQWKNYYNRTVFAKVMVKWKRVQFFWLTVYMPVCMKQIAFLRCFLTQNRV